MMERSNIARYLAVAWMGVILIIVLLALNKQSSFDSSIMSLLPKSQQQPLVQAAVEQLNDSFSQQVTFLLSGKDEQKIREEVGAFVDVLTNEDSTSARYISEVIWRTEVNQLRRLRQELFPYRFMVLDKTIRNQLIKKDFKAITNKALHRLYSPFPQEELSLVEDPFGLYSELANHYNPSLNISIVESLLKVTKAENPTYMFNVKLVGDASSPSIQESILSVVERQRKILESKNINMYMSGMLLHAAAGAEQAKKEISMIGIGSIMGIVLIMLYVFRHIRPLLLMLLAIGVGCIVASAVTVLVFEKVHLITFAFGAGIVGVSIDYALHYLCEHYSTRSITVVRRILPGLVLALVSSVLAYSAQGLTAFPGLRQMAIFSVSGLIAAWLTVVCLFPLLAKNNSHGKLFLIESLESLKSKLPLLKDHLMLKLLLVVMIISAGFVIWTSDDLDDIRLLQTSSEELLKEEKHVRDLLGIKSSSKFLLVMGDSIETCLQQEESFRHELEGLQKSKQLDGYQLLSSRLPSLNGQKENVRLIEELYSQELSKLYDAIKLPENTFEQGIHVFRVSREKLDAQTWIEFESSKNIKEQIIEISPNEIATVIRLEGDISVQSNAQLATLADQYPAILYVDQVSTISTLLSEYRTRISVWVLLAYIGVFIILLMRYRTEVWRVMFAPVVASVFTLAIVTLIVGGLNLFHFMALILVLGIGLDMGIFLYETEDSPQTWLAVSLSAFTSLLAFGLLALSETPVLYHFGLTVLVGLLFVWLLAPMVRKNNFGEIFE